VRRWGRGRARARWWWFGGGGGIGGRGEALFFSSRWRRRRSSSAVDFPAAANGWKRPEGRNRPCRIRGPNQRPQTINCGPLGLGTGPESHPTPPPHPNPTNPTAPDSTPLPHPPFLTPRRGAAGARAARLHEHASNSQPNQKAPRLFSSPARAGGESRRNNPARRDVLLP
jgi:hypothetical protein